MQSFFQEYHHAKAFANHLSLAGCCNKIPQSGWLLNSRNVFLPVLEVEYLDMGSQPDWALVRALFWVGDI